MFILNNVKEWAKSDRICSIGDEGEMSYRELEERSEALAAYLLETYTGKTPIMLWGDKEHNMLVGVLACLKAGKPYVMVPNYLPTKRVEYMVNGCKPCCVFNFGDVPFVVSGLKEYVKADWEGIFEKYKDAKVSQENWIKPEDLVCIFYTSGSTGIPKGVKISRRNIEALIDWWYPISDIHMDNPRCLNFTPYAFSSSVGTIYNYMGKLGCTLYAVNKKLSADYPRLLEFLFKANPHYYDCTPTFADICMRNKDFNGEVMSNMRQLSVGGEPVSHETARKLMERFPKAEILNAYGATETTIGTIACVITKEMVDADKAMPIGYTSFNSRVEIWDENGKPLPDGEVGELIIISDMISEGYLHTPELTPEEEAKRNSVFFTSSDGIRGYNTHDMAYRENGLIYYLGRSDNLVKVGGYRVEIEDVEKHLSTVSCVENVAVSPATKEQNTLFLVAYIVLKEGCEKSVATMIKIKKEMSEKVHPYMIPQKIVFLDDLPKNTNDKLDRKKLREMSEIK